MDVMSPRERRLIGMIAAVAFLAYMLLWWNAYYAPNNGGDAFVMNEYLHGRLPYRDYYTHNPPGLFFIVFAIARVFGLRLLPYLVFGLVLRTLSVWVLYSMIAARRSPVVAAVVSLVAAIASCTDDSEFVGHYSHLSIAFLLFGAAAAYACVVEPNPAPRRFAWRAALAGVGFGATFLIKQSTGTVGVVLVGAFCVAALVRQSRPRAALGFVAWTGVGVATVVGPAVLWLSANGLLGRYVHLVYGVAPSAKGGILVSLLRPLTAIAGNQIFQDSIALALLTVIGALVAIAWAGWRPKHFAQASTCAGIVLLLAAAFLVGRLGATQSADPFKKPLIALVYLAFGGSVVFGLHRTLRFWRDPSDADSLHGAFVSCVGFACAYSTASSWPAFEPMIYPALAIVLSEAEHEIANRPIRRYVQTAAIVVLIFAVTLSSFRRHQFPYRWAYWIEPPIGRTVARSTQPALAGFTMSEEAAHFIDGATDLIRKNSDPDDTILAFPHLAVLAGLADRRIAGFVPVHWFDTCPDDLARADARAILEKPPAVIVAMALPEPLFAEQEFFFRNGALSGQRDLFRAILEVVRRDKYTEVGRFLAPGYRIPIYVWARPRPPEGSPSQQPEKQPESQ
jgi:hypothetical protein